MKKVRNIVVIVLSVICVGILVFLLWNLRSTEKSAQEIIPEVQPEPMILSILVDTFISKISFPMQPGPEIGSISDA